MTHPRKRPPGKIPWDVVAPHVRARGPELPGAGSVILGPSLGEDAALLRLGGDLWAMASDPITFTSEEAGRLSVIVNANDVSVRGAVPAFYTAVVLMAPGEADDEQVGRLLDQIRSTCEELGVCLVGGHTEVTPGLDHSIVVGTMLGRVRDRALTTSGLQPGNLVGLSGEAGLEGTAVLQHEFAPYFGVPIEASLSVVREALAAAGSPHVTALHDVTEGGVGEALHEMACAAGLALNVDPGVIPLRPETRRVAAALGIDPLGLLGSGSLLVGVRPEGRADLEGLFGSLGVRLTWVARAERRVARPAPTQEEADPSPDRVSTPGPGRATVPRFERDEILKAWLFEGFDACIFDMDGTLIDSDYDWQAIKERLGTDGPSILDHIEGLPLPERAEAWRLLEQIEHDATRSAGLKEGARELLDLLGSRGIKTALVTNNSSRNVSYLLEKFRLHFDLVMSRDDGLYKPSGAPLVEAMRRLGVSPAATLCVGDSHYDVQAGREADCMAVCILHDPENRFGSEADIALPDLRALRCYVELVMHWF